MWQLFDIAYITPAAVVIAYFVAKYLESKYGGDYTTNAIYIGAVIGFILTFVRIFKAFKSDGKNQTDKDSSEVDKE